MMCVWRGKTMTKTWQQGVAFWAALVCVILVGATALAVNNEPHGWGQLQWGMTAESAIKANKAWSKEYKLREIRKILQSRDVIVEGTSDLMGKDVGTQWIFGQRGLHTVVLNWENKRAEEYSAWKDLMKKLEGRWGEPKSASPTGEERVWEGKWTRIEAKRELVASGSAVRVRLTALEAAFKDAPAPAANNGGGDKRDDGGDGQRRGPAKGDDDPFGLNKDDDLGLD